MRVRAIRDCFVGSYRKAGEEFEYEGPKNHHLEPVKAEPPQKAARQQAQKPATEEAE